MPKTPGSKSAPSKPAGGAGKAKAKPAGSSGGGKSTKK